MIKKTILAELRKIAGKEDVLTMPEAYVSIIPANVKGLNLLVLLAIGEYIW